MMTPNDIPTLDELLESQDASDFVKEEFGAAWQRAGVRPFKESFDEA